MAVFRRSRYLLPVAFVALVLTVALITPLNASKRMVLAEEITNVW